mgnify:CR=1 FL=1
MEKIHATKERIMRASFKLFLENGYENTQIRQIAEESQAVTGSIYHFFRNKEDILRALIRPIFTKQIEICQNAVSDEESPLMQYLISCGVQLATCQKHRNLHEIYYLCYTSNDLCSEIIESNTEFLQKALAYYRSNLTRGELYLRCIGTTGALRAYMASGFMYDNIDVMDRIFTFASLTLRAYELPQEEIDRLLHALNSYRKVIDELSKAMIREIGNLM